MIFEVFEGFIALFTIAMDLCAPAKITLLRLHDWFFYSRLIYFDLYLNNDRINNEGIRKVVIRYARYRQSALG
jgi:hypothetical protein